MMVLPSDNTFSTNQVDLADPSLKISPSDYRTRFNNMAYVEGAVEGDEGVAFCLGDLCFAAE